MSEKSESTDKKGMIFTGGIYVLVGILIIFHQELVYYWVSGGFIVQGITSLVRAWKK